MNTRNTTFDVPGLAGMTSSQTAGTIILFILAFCIGVGMITYGVVISRRKPITDHDHRYDDLRSEDRQYNRAGNAPTSDSGFGKPAVQDPAGYWRTAQPYEAPLGVARVRPTVPEPRRHLGGHYAEPQPQRVMPRQAPHHRHRAPLAIAARPVSPGTGYRTDPRQTQLLGLFDDGPIPANTLRAGQTMHLRASGELPAPISPPMYPTPVPTTPEQILRSWNETSYTPEPTEDEIYQIAPTSPAVPSAYHYRPVSTANYAPFTYEPIAPPAFNPLGQTYVPPQADVSVGRHARGFTAKGTDTQRALTERTGQIDLIDMRRLLEVG